MYIGIYVYYIVYFFSSFFFVLIQKVKGKTGNWDTREKNHFSYTSAWTFWTLNYINRDTHMRKSRWLNKNHDNNLNACICAECFFLSPFLLTSSAYPCFKSMPMSAQTHIHIFKSTNMFFVSLLWWNSCYDNNFFSSFGKFHFVIRFQE